MTIHNKHGSLRILLVALLAIGTTPGIRANTVHRSLLRGDAKPVTAHTHDKKGRQLQSSTTFAPITKLTAVFDGETCPEGYTLLPQDLNAGTNGKQVNLCFNRGLDTDPIQEITFITSADNDTPSCPEGFEAVLQDATSEIANLNEGATGWSGHELWMTMCYRRDPDSCDEHGNCEAIYQLQTLRGHHTSAPRWFVRQGQNLNQGSVGGEAIYLSYSNSPSFVAGAVAVADGHNPQDTAMWSNAVEDANGGDIDVTLNFDCQKDGGDDSPLCYGNSPLEDAEFERLCQLARDGIEEYWSGSVTVQGVTRNVKVRTVEGEDGVDKDIDICSCGDDFGDGSVCYGPFGWTDGTHHNSDWDVMDMTIWYMKGRYSSQEELDKVFKLIAAHEIGHSFLYDYGGLWHSWNHKGSSNIITSSVTEEAPECPESGDLDMMYYYREPGTTAFGLCWFDVTSGKYSVSVDPWDRAKMLMTVGEYSYSDPGDN